jgi:hypothetical protein
VHFGFVAGPVGIATVLSGAGEGAEIGGVIGGAVGVIGGVWTWATDFSDWNAQATVDYKVTCLCKQDHGKKAYRLHVDTTGMNALTDNKRNAVGLNQEVILEGSRGYRSYARNMHAGDVFPVLDEGLLNFAIDPTLGGLGGYHPVEVFD